MPLACPGQRSSKGRPLTTGEYVGLAVAKEWLTAAKKAELDLQLEEECCESITGLRSLDLMETTSREEMSFRINTAVEAVMKMATTFSHFQDRLH